MGKTSTYWITPNGKILKPAQYHIGTVIDHPELFGMTDKQIKKIYDKHDEKISPFLEGKAREEIMTMLLKKKFIRIRPKINDYLWEWSNKESKQAQDKYADVNIHILQGNKMIRTSLDRLASGETIKESVGGNRRLLTENECNQIHIYTEDEISMLPSYFDYAEELIDENTEQWIIDEILEHKYSTMMKYLK